LQKGGFKRTFSGRRERGNSNRFKTTGGGGVSYPEKIFSHKRKVGGEKRAGGKKEISKNLTKKEAEIRNHIIIKIFSKRDAASCRSANILCRTIKKSFGGGTVRSRGRKVRPPKVKSKGQRGKIWPVAVALKKGDRFTKGEKGGKGDT